MLAQHTAKSMRKFAAELADSAAKIEKAATVLDCSGVEKIGVNYEQRRGKLRQWLHDWHHDVVKKMREAGIDTSDLE